MADMRCPYCQCEIALVDGLLKRTTRAAMWLCLGGFLAVLAAGFDLPALGPKPLDPNWVSQVRSANKDDPAKAEQIIRKEEDDNKKDWEKHMSATDRAIVDTRSALRGLRILLLCVGIPSAILTLVIRPEPVQKRPPARPA